MKKLILCLILGVSACTAFSQKVYFVYIQAEPEQPFFVKLDGKIHSSTGSGYLILSKLIDSSYDIAIGFPQNKWADQEFTIEINKKDHGFLLKQFAEKGWGLFNLQTLAVQMAKNAGTGNNLKQKGNNEVSDFTEILAIVADDPSIKEKPVRPKVEEKKPEVIVAKVEKKVEDSAPEKKAEVKTDKIEGTPVIINEKVDVVKSDNKPVVIIEKLEPQKKEKEAVEEVKPVQIVKDEVVNKNELDNKEEKTAIVEIQLVNNTGGDSYVPSKIKKWAESSTTEGFGLVFIDDYNNGLKDTIRLIIPNQKIIEVPVVAKSELREEKKFIDIESNEVKRNVEVPLEEVKSVKKEKSANNKLLTTNCTIIADENDFFTLRKQMAAKVSDDEMLSEAQNYFKAKCFTTEQLSNLVILFLNDKSRYKFFDLAYGYVSDEENFSTLQNKLTDEYYLNRFRAMIRN